jgi:hypothetical protein
MKNRHPHARMIDEMLHQGYDVVFKKLSLNVITRNINKTKYQVFSEDGKTNKLHDKITDATDHFLTLKQKRYK